MDALFVEGMQYPPEGFCEHTTVSSRREALLAKGAAQGWLMRASELRILHPIGAGTFGQTYSAIWRGALVLPARLLVFPSELRPSSPV
jgi:hypothetical protein